MAAITSAVIRVGAPACCRAWLRQACRSCGDARSIGRRTRTRLASGQELIGAQALGEPSVAGQYHGQQDVGVEIGGGQQPQFGQHGGLHLLCLVDHQHRPAQGALDMRLPALAQDLGAAVAVMRAQFDAEEFAHLAVEVGDVGLRPADHADR